MDLSRATAFRSQSLLLLLLFFLLVVSPLFVSPAAAASAAKEDEEKKDQGPGPVERAIGVTGSGWDAVKSWAKLAWLNLRTPDSAQRSDRGSGAGGVVKEAAKRSFETSKETMEKAAAGAAGAAEEAVEKTKEKVKRTVSKARGGGDPDAEL